MINSGLKDLKEDIKKMSEAEIENKDPKSTVNIVKKILKFNKQNQQKGQGLKILTLTKWLIGYQLLYLNCKQEIILTSLKIK